MRKVHELVEDGAIKEFQDGNHGSLYPRKSEFGNTGIPFITATQIIDGQVDIDAAPRLSHDRASELRIGFTRPLDVLLTHNATVGRVAVLPANAPPCLLGTEYVTLRVAVRRSADHTDFFTVELWGRLANVALNHVSTGRMLSLRCELRQQEWGEGEDRKERISLVVRKLGLLSPPGATVIEADAA